MKIACIHDWLDTFGGAESVLEALLEMYDFDFFTLFATKKMREHSVFKNTEVTTSFIENLPFAKKHARRYLPLFPLAIEQFDLREYDVLVSSSSCVSKGILKRADQLHVCYCYTPMRYAWDLYFDYLDDFNLKRGVKKWMAKLTLHYLRMWDYQSANRVDHFVAISNFVAKRIKSIYGRDSHVIYPPVDTEFFTLKQSQEEFYVTASRMVPYKKMDLIIRAFAKRPHAKLIVIGDGSERAKLELLAKPYANIEILGKVEPDVMRDYFQRAKAFVFTALEDFGIVPLEAQSCGTPVIAYGRGGSLETVVHGKTGLFFNEQTEAALIKVLDHFETVQSSFDPQTIRAHALTFSRSRFQKEFAAHLQKLVDNSSTTTKEAIYSNV